MAMLLIARAPCKQSLFGCICANTLTCTRDIRKCVFFRSFALALVASLTTSQGICVIDSDFSCAGTAGPLWQGRQHCLWHAAGQPQPP